MAKITIAQETIDTNEQVQELAINAVTKGADVKPDGDNAVYIVGDTKLSVDVAKFIASVGGEVEGFQLFAEVVPTDLVPEGIRGRATTDEEGVETVKTWEQWRTILVRDSRNFIELSDGKDYLKISELVPVFDLLIKPEDLPVDAVID
jgi:hypothetical protein